MMSLRKRSAELEIMDDLDCHGEVVDQTLRELDVINTLLGGNYVTIDGIKELISYAEDTFMPAGTGQKELRARGVSIADFGCGSGDLLKKIVEWGRRRNIKINASGIDANPHIIKFARQHNPDITFESLNVFENKTTYDIITATLFVHHFDDDQLVELFKSMNAHSRIGVVINDIHRHFLSYHSIRLLTKIFSKSAMVKFDAPLSVRRAFKKRELIDILKRAGINDYKLKWKWAFRWQLVWHSFS